MPTITKREDSHGNASWQAKVRLSGFPPKSMTFGTKREAQEWARNYEAELQAGLVVSNKLSEDTLFRDLMQTYLEEVTPTKGGADKEAVRLKFIMRDPLAQYAVANVTTRALASYRDRRLAQVSGSTVRRELNLISAILEKARKEWDFGIKPRLVADLDKPKPPPHRERRLHDGEEEQLLEAAGKTRSTFLKPIIILALDTAMRQGEIRTLRWEFFDAKRRILTLKPSKDFSTKNGKTRIIPLTVRAYDTLKALLKQQVLADKVTAERPVGEVFPGLKENAIRLAYSRMVKRLGLEGLTFHDLRHEATSRLFDKGLALNDVQAINGDSLASLQRYVHAKNVADLVKVIG